MPTQMIRNFKNIHNFWARQLKLNHIHRYRLKSRFCHEVNFLAGLTDFVDPSKTSLAIDLGSGPTPKNPFNSANITGIDRFENSNVLKADFSLIHCQ